MTASDLVEQVFAPTSEAAQAKWFASKVNTGEASPVDYTDADGQQYYTSWFQTAGAHADGAYRWAVGVQVFEKAEESTTALENATLLWSEIYVANTYITQWTENVATTNLLSDDDDVEIPDENEENEDPADDTNTPDGEGSDAEDSEDGAPVVDAGEVVENGKPAEAPEVDPAPETDAE